MQTQIQQLQYKQCLQLLVDTANNIPNINFNPTLVPGVLTKEMQN